MGKCVDCNGTGQADWTSEEYVIPCGTCGGGGIVMPSMDDLRAEQIRAAQEQAFDFGLGAGISYGSDPSLQFPKNPYRKESNGDV